MTRPLLGILLAIVESANVLAYQHSDWIHIFERGWHAGASSKPPKSGQPPSRELTLLLDMWVIEKADSTQFATRDAAGL